MIESILSKVPCERVVARAKTELLEAGKVSRKVFLVRTGCVRLWYNNEGEDITLQFFMPGQMVASFDSLLKKCPSKFSMETILPSEIDVYKIENIENCINGNAGLERAFTMKAFDVASRYVDLFLSRIKDSPQKRYELLLQEHPEIIMHIPQHYIATYLGITPVSLSRIRARLGIS